MYEQRMRERSGPGICEIAPVGEEPNSVTKGALPVSDACHVCKLLVNTGTCESKAAITLRTCGTRGRIELRKLDSLKARLTLTGMYGMGHIGEVE